MKNILNSRSIRKANGARGVTKRRQMFLPGFGGFHKTKWERLLDKSQQLYARMDGADRDGGDGLEMLSQFNDVSKHRASIARAWCVCFERKITESLGFAPRLKFERIEPGDYIFTTDRIVATVPIGTAQRLFELSEQEDHRGLSNLLRNWFAPMPHHSKLIRAWAGSQRLDRWDRNELCLLLDAFTDPDIDDEIYAEIGGGGAMTLFEYAVDRKKKVAKLARRRTPCAPRRRPANHERIKA
ncbi:MULTISPECIES: hypothetical protein [Bradyrhizobium]|uniref:hypothetical protein n=1 Tax=Bradyrhizobium TaxID=374 RepID=UPI00195849EE|nr:hypothetical protein [Bradyrhizobium canariense]MBM7486119.1 hypothetical protein [Bradyrhizobium canariense]